jgi:hypothetical protein
MSSDFDWKTTDFEATAAEVQGVLDGLRPAPRLSFWQRLKRAIIGGYKLGGVVGLYHWVRCHTWNRYHLFDIRKADGEYDYGWIDRDEALLLVCFTVLTDFVEGELLPFPSTLEEPPGAETLKILALYDWWTKERPRARAALYKSWSVDRRRELERVDQCRLHQLVRLRPYLWT